VKILDRYILTSFITTFASVFIILFFIFVLQGIWLFISELAGKDLDIWLVLKFLAFYSPKIVPLVLPLSILLASIMTFGNFAENYEFAAMKSSGISLSRAMRGLTIFIFGLSIVAFFFANNVIPKAEYKFINLRKNIIQRKPAMAIVAGQFNAIGAFNIKVDKKSGENGEKLTGVTIHKRKPGAPNATIIRSKKGLLKSSEDSNLLQLELYDGYYYEEVSSTQRERQPFAKSSFSKQIMNIDLTMLNTNDMDDEQIAHTNTMLNVRELNFTLDSLENNYSKEARSIADNIVQRSNSVLGIQPKNLIKGLPGKEIKEEKKDSVPKNILDLVKTKSDKARLLDMAANNLSSSEFTVTSGKEDLFNKVKNINNHWLALYDKFVIAFACLLMFFIGAPLGAIIRKGGLGLPIVFAVLIFIIFHFINTFGRKLAQEDGITPFFGSWMSSFVLSPLAVLLTYRATNDMGVSINFDWLIAPFQRMFAKDNSDEQPIVNLDRIQIIEDDEEWEKLSSLPDNALIDVVKNAKQFKYTTAYRNKALKLLEYRDITQEDLLATNNLYNTTYQKLEFAYGTYRLYTNATIISYLVCLCLAPFEKTGKLAYIIPGFLSVIVFYIAIYKSHESLDDIGKLVGRKVGANLFLALFLGFPFFFIIYFYNKSALKQALAQHNYKL
jgi:lipopolysaccharide export system permease protein